MLLPSRGNALQGFRNPREIDRFTSMFEEMCYIVATKHSGSLKGVHPAHMPRGINGCCPVVATVLPGCL